MNRWIRQVRFAILARWLIVAAFVLLFCGLMPLQMAWAGNLQQRVESFPDWQQPPKGTLAKGELIYPAWFAGTWRATSTLQAAIAPFAPEIVTPGFAQNQATMGQSVVFTVRFTDDVTPAPIQGVQGITGFPQESVPLGIVADRVFNSKNLGDATMGSGFVQSVQIDPGDLNRLITEFQSGQRLISESRERAVESEPGVFMSSELFLQTFRGDRQIYLNRVENTTRYRLVKPQKIEADQMTAIYLSPKDPDYFRTRNRPVALYRYDLVLDKISDS